MLWNKSHHLKQSFCRRLVCCYLHAVLMWLVSLQTPTHTQCTLKPVLSGNANFWQLILYALPTLVLFYIATVLTLSSIDAGMLAYVRNWVFALTGGLHASHLLALAFRPLLMLMVLGVLLGVIDSAFSTGDCIGFLTRMTTATVQTESTWQWLWVVVHCSAVLR